MWKYILRRALLMIPTLLFVSFLIYGLLELAPGDPATAMIDPEAPPEQYEELKKALGIDKPFPVRYVKWLGEVFQGNLGYSYGTGLPVTVMLGRRIGATLELMISAFVISTVLGIVFGTQSALHKYSPLDHTLTALGMIGISIPAFFAGLLAIFVFAIGLNWLPIGGRLTPAMRNLSGIPYTLERLKHLILPAFILGLNLTAALMRYTRSAILDVMQKDYVVTAKSKGLSQLRVNYVHTMRNALIPVVLVLSFRLIMLVGGSVIIESIFSWPGMGLLFIESVRGRDYPVIMAVTMISSIMVLTASLVADVMTALVDPRVRYE